MSTIKASIIYNVQKYKISGKLQNRKAKCRFVNKDI